MDQDRNSSQKSDTDVHTQLAANQSNIAILSSIALGHGKALGSGAFDGLVLIL